MKVFGLRSSVVGGKLSLLCGLAILPWAPSGY
jgi:hypothetical protein